VATYTLGTQECDETKDIPQVAKGTTALPPFVYLPLMRVKDQSPKCLAKMFSYATKAAFVTTSIYK